MMDKLEITDELMKSLGAEARKVYERRFWVSERIRWDEKQYCYVAKDVTDSFAKGIAKAESYQFASFEAGYISGVVEERMKAVEMQAAIDDAYVWAADGCAGTAAKYLSPVASDKVKEVE